MGCAWPGLFILRMLYGQLRGDARLVAYDDAVLGRKLLSSSSSSSLCVSCALQSQYQPTTTTTTTTKQQLQIFFYFLGTFVLDMVGGIPYAKLAKTVRAFAETRFLLFWLFLHDVNNDKCERDTHTHTNKQQCRTTNCPSLIRLCSSPSTLHWLT